MALPHLSFSACRRLAPPVTPSIKRAPPLYMCISYLFWTRFAKLVVGILYKTDSLKRRRRPRLMTTAARRQLVQSSFNVVQRDGFRSPRRANGGRAGSELQNAIQYSFDAEQDGMRARGRRRRRGCLNGTQSTECCAYGRDWSDSMWDNWSQKLTMEKDSLVNGNETDGRDDPVWDF